MKIISLYYHEPIISGFEKMIKYWQRRGYRFISIDEVRDIIVSKKEVGEKLAFITLDDGWHQNIELLLSQVRNNNEWKTVWNTYPTDLMPIYHRFVGMMINFNLWMGIYLLTKIKR